jgi:hypothetical protein
MEMIGKHVSFIFIFPIIRWRCERAMSSVTVLCKAPAAPELSGGNLDIGSMGNDFAYKSV